MQPTLNREGVLDNPELCCDFYISHHEGNSRLPNKFCNFSFRLTYKHNVRNRIYKLKEKKIFDSKFLVRT